MAAVRPAGESVFQEGRGGRIIIVPENQAVSLRSDPRWIAIPKDQESNFIDSQGRAIQGANSIIAETQSAIPDAGTDVGAQAAQILSATDQTNAFPSFTTQPAGPGQAEIDAIRTRLAAGETSTQINAFDPVAAAGAASQPRTAVTTPAIGQAANEGGDLAGPASSSLPASTGDARVTSNKFQALADILAAINDGTSPITSVQGLREAIAAIPGVAAVEVEGLFGSIRENLSPTFLATGGPDASGTVPAPAADIAVVPSVDPSVDPSVPTSVPQPSTPISQRELFQQETAADRSRRLQADVFGSFLTPAGQRVASNSFNRFQSQQQIFNPGGTSPIPASDAFRSFRGQPRTSEDITAGLLALQQGGNTAAFESQFGGEGGVQRAFNASLQPSLQGINAAARGRIGDIERERFALQLAQNPEQFQTSESVLDLLTAFPGFGGR